MTATTHPTPASPAPHDLDEAVCDFVRHRAVIEQAKGMLMLIYGIDADHAFELLRWQSQDTNVKLRDLAQQVVARFTTSLSIDSTLRNSADYVLLTAHRHTGVPGEDRMAELPQSPEGVPDVVRRAIAFVDEHLADDIGVEAIAAAVFLSPRMVQMVFRRYLNLTPTEFVRQRRLERAHHQLLIADAHAVTVKEVASKWKLGHAGRFAIAYRAKYGQAPKDTLRGGMSFNQEI